MDAIVRYFAALRQYVAATPDKLLLAEVFPVPGDMVRWHIRGTRYNIHVDSAERQFRKALGHLCAVAPH